MKRLYKLTSCFQYTHSMDSFKDADSYSGQMAFDCKNAGKAPKSQAMTLSVIQLPAEINFANKQMQLECNSLTKLGNSPISERRTLTQL